MVEVESLLAGANALERTQNTDSQPPTSPSAAHQQPPKPGDKTENAAGGANGLATKSEALSEDAGSGPKAQLEKSEKEVRRGTKEGKSAPEEDPKKEKTKRRHDKKGDLDRERGGRGRRERSRERDGARSRIRDSKGDYPSRRGRTMGRDRDKKKTAEGHSKRSKRYSQPRSRSDSPTAQAWKVSRRASRSRERRVGGDRHGRSKSRARKRVRRSTSKQRLKSRSVSRRGHRRSRSRSERRSRSASGDYGGYIPRRRQEAPLPGGGTSNEPLVQDPPGNCVTQDQGGPQLPSLSLRQWREQQLRSRQLILQQAVSAQVGRGREGFSPLPCPTRQVYVGNLVPGLVSEAALRQLFNSALSAVFPDSLQPGMQPVISVSMHSDGRYAFVELRTPEMATDALQLSGQVQLFGQSISVGRPSGYVDPGKAAAAAQAAAAALAAFQAADPTASGPVPGGQGQLGMVQIGMLTGTALAASPASAFICVEGMVTLDTLTSDATYRKIIADLRNECVKHGAVIQLKIPRPADPKMAQVLFSTGFYGKAFVQFSDATAATRAREGLNGHNVQGRTLAVTFVSQEVFAAII